MKERFRGRHGWWGFMQDEQGALSMARALLLVHTLQNWIWMWLLLTSRIEPLEGSVLTLLIGTLDVTMFIVFGAWAGGPRMMQYLLPQLAGAVRGAGAVLHGGAAMVRARLENTDNVRKDDERGDP